MATLTVYDSPVAGGESRVVECPDGEAAYWASKILELCGSDLAVVTPEEEPHLLFGSLGGRETGRLGVGSWKEERLALWERNMAWREQVKAGGLWPVVCGLVIGEAAEWYRRHARLRAITLAGIEDGEINPEGGRRLVEHTEGEMARLVGKARKDFRF